MSHIVMCNRKKNRIRLSIADNPVSDEERKIFKVQSSGTVDMETVIAEVAEVFPLIPPETIRALLRVSQRIQIRSLSEGKRLNMGMYIAELRSRGVAYNGKWNPAVNSLYVHIRPGKELREAVADIDVEIIGEKESPMCIIGGESPSGDGFEAVSGNIFTLRGKYIKIAGDEPSVGITLTDADGGEVKIPSNLIAVNLPSKIVFQLPEELADGEYTLRVTTQYTTRGLLKKPHWAERGIRVRSSWQKSL